MIHRLARLPLAAMIVALAAAAPAVAQGNSWQGVVTFRTSASSANDTSQMIYYQGSGVARFETAYGNDHVAIIVDPPHSTSITIVPSRRMYMVNTTSQTADNIKKRMEQTTITNTGRTEVVAGHKCTYYHIVDKESSEVTNACVATDMGTFAVLQQGMGRGNGSFWERMFSAKGGFFPLKVITHENGKDQVRMVATSIQPKSLDAALFQPPADYTNMSAMRHPSH